MAQPSGEIVDRVRSDVQPSSNPANHTARWKAGHKLWMKDSRGIYTILVWVVEKGYNGNRDGWDYKVRQKDVNHREWVGLEYWRAETELRRA